jgi:CheY-like chemotaxis protein
MDKLVELIPSLLWFFLVVFILILFYRPIRDNLLPKLGSFKAMGVEILFAADSIDASVELAEKNQQWKVKVFAVDKRRVLNRVKQHLNILKGAQVLWVDDYPENNINERRMFRQLETGIDIARSTQEALEILKNGRYDVVFSDMARGENAKAGLEFLEQFRKTDKTTPVIFYIGVFDPEKGTPAQAFGITNRPDELLHLALDALERKKY